MPLEAIDQMFFARALVTAEDLILRLRCKGYSEEDELFEAQTFVLGPAEGDGALPLVLLQIEKSDPLFPTKVLEFATGFSYLPNSDDFNIYVEFDPYDEDESKSPDSLIVSRTCENIITLPKTAYNRNVFRLKEKLVYSIEASAGFDMN